LENLYLGDDYDIAKNKNKIRSVMNKYNLINYN
jgi:hypothetical protein